MFNAVISAPFGRLGIRTDAQALSEVVYLPPDTPLHAPDNALAELAARQAERFFVDPDAAFDLPRRPQGTRHQQQVWAAIARVPRGQVLTYGALAREVGSVARAVGQACGANPLPLLVPCHRIVAANGIGGFAHDPGEGFLRSVKRWLLRHEGVRL
ncbi:methylated-DNA--[protein]-cysteine S-methyltransferase [Chitinasiproducens palmae]|uniref:Methylated-DNA-[protein]-cysteine S-methyltransferase n=1 Tax=Chitinasiproducens palmae TaxID=1770053 RepID=A0A1H2PRD3_9BURK|nr:methylated-DNA--[protein]-cysteine S-methyltransferase [Chitinasiproducens palmae]SDV49440.1 methylated-DNA-[protein]-cysteine S-methyltransferase [Chitinasiproducens palmae]